MLDERLFYRFLMDQRSESILKQVHPDLVRVIENTIQTPQAFTVVYGIRTLAVEEEAVRTGHSQTLHSRHLPNKDGLSCAVDVAALVLGKLSFAPGDEAEVFGNIARQIKTSAKELNIEVQWGGDWITFKDWGHFQLPWELYS